MGIAAKGAEIAERFPGGKIAVGTVDKILNWSRASSLWYFLFGLACCAVELMCTGASRYDFDRLGMIFRASPRQVDLMIIAGTVTYKMAERIKVLYEQMAEPRYVVAMGSCAISGGGFAYDNYSVLRGVDKIIPVDVYIPGCPPRPESLMHGCLMVHKLIRTEKIKEWSAGKMSEVDLGEKPYPTHMK